VQILTQKTLLAVQEREASSHYCQEAATLWQKAQTFEAEISAKMQQVMALVAQGLMH
jgi:hypothetical protein